MMDSKQLKEYIIIPVLNSLEGYNACSDSAVNLLLGTAAVETDMGKYLHQIDGPALGIYSMEPATANDIYAHYLHYRPELMKMIDRYRIPLTDMNNLEGNLYYATAMARVHYLRIAEALPKADDIKGLASYWKRYYNTAKGAHSFEDACDKFVTKYNQYMRS